MNAQTGRFSGRRPPPTRTSTSLNTQTLTGYITKCMEDVTVTKDITVRANEKPWFTREVRELLRARNVAFKSGDKEALKSARANLHRGVRAAKRAYGQKKKSTHTSLTQRTQDACGKASSQSQTTNHPPHRVRTTQTSSTHSTPSSAGLKKITPQHPQKNS